MCTRNNPMDHSDIPLLRDQRSDKNLKQQTVFMTLIKAHAGLSLCSSVLKLDLALLILPHC